MTKAIITSLSERHMGSIQCWAVAVGMVISGQYFGWNQGFAYANLPTMLTAFFVVTFLYAGFMRLLLMLSVAMPANGGIMLYWRQLDRPFIANLVGVAALCEYFFAFTAVAEATGAYWHGLMPSASPEQMSVVFLLLFCLINILGVKQSLWVELVTTLLALLGLLIFNVASLHAGEWRVWSAPQSVFSWHGLWRALPYVLWLYLGIEGSVLSAAEVKQPQKTLPRSIRAAMLTLIITAVFTVIQVASLLPSATLISHHPLTSALHQRPRLSMQWINVVSMLALFGLFASLNGLMIAASRQLLALVDPVANFVFREKVKVSPVQIFLVLGLAGVWVLCSVPESTLLLFSIAAVLVLYVAGIVVWFACARAKVIIVTMVDVMLALLISVLILIAMIAMIGVLMSLC